MFGPRYSLSFRATATAPGNARRFVRATLTDWGLPSLVEDAELIASELVTNAVQATGNPDPDATDGELLKAGIVGAQVRMADGLLFVEIWDNDFHPCMKAPQWPATDPLPEGGRGIGIVHALASKFGVHSIPGFGKVVWAALSIGECGANSWVADESELPKGWRGTIVDRERQRAEHVRAAHALFDHATRAMALATRGR